MNGLRVFYSLKCKSWPFVAELYFLIRRNYQRLWLVFFPTLISPDSISDMIITDRPIFLFNCSNICTDIGYHGNIKNISPFSAEQIPGKMQGYNWLNETIELPPVEIMPPVLKGLQDANGNQYYTVTGERTKDSRVQLL